MARWMAKAWPPQADRLDLLLLRAAETVAMAAEMYSGTITDLIAPKKRS